jgi:hypothetical protein
VTLPVILGCLWLVAANVLGLIPSRDHHWFRAYVLIAVGIPLLGWITWQSGPLIGLLFFAAGASVLRWPLVFFGRWLRRIAGR